MFALFVFWNARPLKGGQGEMTGHSRLFRNKNDLKNNNTKNNGQISQHAMRNRAMEKAKQKIKVYYSRQVVVVFLNEFIRYIRVLFSLQEVMGLPLPDAHKPARARAPPHHPPLRADMT